MLLLFLALHHEVILQSLGRIVCSVASSFLMLLLDFCPARMSFPNGSLMGAMPGGCSMLGRLSLFPCSARGLCELGQAAFPEPGEDPRSLEATSG